MNFGLKYNYVTIKQTCGQHLHYSKETPALPYFNQFSQPQAITDLVSFTIVLPF